MTIRDRLASLQPERLCAYVESQGWIVYKSEDDRRLYIKDERVVTVPFNTTYVDYVRRVEDVLREIVKDQGLSVYTLVMDDLDHKIP